MKSVDTNVLARFFVDDPDDPEAERQRNAAERALSEPIFVSATVLLELEWVMRAFYQLPTADCLRVLNAICGIDSATVEDRERVLTAIEWRGRGMDFADALHLARSQACEAFVTFDRSLQRTAKRLEASPVVELVK